MDLVTEALSAYYTQVPFIGAELTYIDAFSFESGETPLQFFTKKLAVQFQLPQPFLEAPFVEQEPSSASLSFEFQITDPVGSLTLSLDHAELIERPGYVMDTRVRSLGSALTYSPEGLTDWLESAHRVQQHAFNTIIKPAYHESFQ